jgi:hypothetical protein
MPIRPENRARYPADWQQIRERIMVRAGNKCEKCSVANYALGGRTRDGRWHRALPLGEHGLHLAWPTPGAYSWCTYGEHRHLLRIVKIVCTTAHIDHVPEHCDDSNLLFLCQRCHLLHDQQHHSETAYATRRQGKAIGDMFA